MTCSKLWLCRLLAVNGVSWYLWGGRESLANEHAQLWARRTQHNTALSLQSSDTPGERILQRAGTCTTSLDSGMGILQGLLEGRADCCVSAAATCPQGQGACLTSRWGNEWSSRITEH